MMNYKSQRESSIELLRILAACAVVVLHYNNATLGGAMAVMEGSRKIVMLFLNSLLCCAVNVFIMISGFFLSTKQTRSIGKPFSLYLQVVLISLIGYGIQLYQHEATFNPLHVVFTIIPHNYFVMLYIALYFISPFLNKFLLSLNKNQYKKLLIITVILFSVYNSAIELLGDLTNREMIGRNTIGQWGTQYGYTIVNFTLVYCIGGYLKRFGFPNIIKKWAIPIAIACTLTIFGLRLLLHGGPSASSYCNPFVILLAVCILRMFESKKWQSVLVNELASAAFACFPFHLMVISRIGIKTYAVASTIPFILHLLFSVIFIYLASYLFYKIYMFCFSPLLRLFDKIHISYEEGQLIIKK